MAESELDNFQSCCRLCLCENLDDVKSIFDETIEDRSLPQKIYQFLAIEISDTDKLTTMVCQQCIIKVDTWQLYKSECVENQRKLEQRLNCFQTKMTNGFPPLNVLIKEEPMTEAEEPAAQPTSIGPTHNIEVVQIKNEPMDHHEESMEAEYNELPPTLAPYQHDNVGLDSENLQESGWEVNRKCSICEKLFSSAGNRKKHEKQIHGIHQEMTPRTQNEIQTRKPMDGPFIQGETSTGQERTEMQISKIESADSDQQKIQFAAGLKLLQTNSTPIACEELSKIELSYAEKCKAMVAMHKTLECACHKVPHPNLKGLLSHLRALRIWFPVFTCYNCMITFTCRSTFTRHNVRCPKTPLETITKLSNLRKRSEVKTRLYQNFKCTICKFMYSFHDDFCKHVDIDHSSLELPVVCFCSRRFDNIEDYKDHVYVSCLVEYYCDICFITTKTLDHFVKHASEVHDNSEGFILLQDDNYKMRKPLMHVSPKQVLNESVILEGKRERRMSKCPLFEDIDDEQSPSKVINPAYSQKMSTSCRTCPICAKEYSTYNNLMRHYRTHLEVPEKKVADESSYYSCPDCGGMYNTTEWQEHLEQKHEAKPCGECGKTFQFQTELDQHRSVHLNLKVYRDSKTQSYKSTMISPTSDGEVLPICEICDILFTTREELDEHKLTHDTSEMDQTDQNSVSSEKKYTCEPCDKVYTSYGGIWEHNKKNHADTKTPMMNKYPKQCKYCDKVLTTGAAYFRHQTIHERDLLPSDASLMKGAALKVKRNELGNDGEDYHTCKRCFKVFSSRYNLKNHLKSHGINSTATNKKPLRKVDPLSMDSEEMEDGQYDMDETAEAEIDVEGEESYDAPIIYTCDVCVMVFATKDALKKHKETHLVDVKPSVHKPAVYCKFCKVAFDSVVLLARHMHDKHNESKPKIDKEKPHRQYACHICKKFFQSAPALSTHVGWHKRTHHGTDINGKASKVLKQNKIIDKFAASAKVKQEPLDEPKHQCATCLAELPNDTALQVHILEKHRSVSAIMLIPRCNVCNKDFNNQDEYETHKRLHDFLERQKQHEQNMLLQQQEQDTLNEQPKPTTSQLTSSQQKFSKSFPCKYCTAAFSRADTLGAHVRQYHKDFIVSEFRCNQCDRVFDKQNSLTIHLKVHEKQKVVMNTPAKPLFSCSICNMGFDLPKDLRAHTINDHPF